MPKVAEIWGELGFKFERTTLGDFINSVRDLDMTVVASVIGVGGLYKALQDITVDAVKAATAIKLFGIETGLSSEEIQMWTQFAERVGISSQDILGAIKHLQEMTGPSRDVKDTLRELNQAIQGMDPVMARLRLQGFGVASLMPMLSKNTADFNEELKKLDAISSKQTDSLYKLGVSARTFGIDIATSFNQFASLYAPNLTESIGLLEKMFDRTNPKASAFFDELINWVTAAGLSIIDFADLVAISQKNIKDWQVNDFQRAIDDGMAARASGQTNSPSISITVHGAVGGPAAIAEAIQHELTRLFMHAEHQSPKRRT
jgi:hypothetical protein